MPGFRGGAKTNQEGLPTVLIVTPLSKHYYKSV